MTSKEIIELLPYRPPFLFVDELTKISDEFIEGHYRLKEDEYFACGDNSPFSKDSRMWDEEGFGNNGNTIVSAWHSTTAARCCLHSQPGISAD